MKAICLLLLLGTLMISSFAQEKTFENLYFKKKKPPKKDFYLSEIPNYYSGFYIYRNCIYDFIKNNKEHIKARIIDIRNDSIYYVPYFNKEVAGKYGVPFDTLSLHPSEIRMVRQINDGFFVSDWSVSLRRFNYNFEYGDSGKRFESHIKTVFNIDSGCYVDYELVRYMTGTYLDSLYEQGGQLQLYRGKIKHSPADTPEKKDEHRVHNFIWYTPSGANKINGIHLSLQTINTRNGFLVINGLSCSADAGTAIASLYGLFEIYPSSILANFADTLDTEPTHDQVNGLSLSAGGLGGDEITMNGVSINGGLCLVHRANGLVISGMQNMQDAFDGIVIAGLHNTAIKGRGIQIGLLNTCKNLKGIQIGLWNNNSRRSLPFINWCFKPKIKA